MEELNSEPGTRNFSNLKLFKPQLTNQQIKCKHTFFRIKSKLLILH